MPRLREIPRDEVPNDFIRRAYDRMFGPDRDPVAEPGTATGTPGNWWTCFANSPEVFHHAVAGFSLYQKSGDRLNPVLRQILDLTYITAMYAMHATLSRALRLEYDDRDEP